MEKQFARKLVKPALLLVFLASLGGNIFLLSQAATVGPSETVEAQAEMKALVETVGKLMVLPEGEDPTIATVTDPAKLSSQDFFKRAQLGDKVLLYTTAKKAILYSPLTGKIVEVAPINIGSSTAETSPEVADTTVPEVTP